ncbi:GldG family protein [Patescibacteria group bacterium]|nr:GldG family protein [Patescibacteria group bacterium]
MNIRGRNIFTAMTGINLILALVLINIVINFLPELKLDLTKNKLHTLSPATVKIVHNLKDLVKIKVYLSSQLPPNAKPIADNLKTVLADFQNLNKTNLEVSYLDPLKDDKAKQEAQQYGIQPLQFSTVNNDKLEVQTGYFGLAMVYGNKQEVLSVAGDVGNLEYFLVSGIKKLTTGATSKVVLAGGNGEVADTEIQAFSKYLNDNYQVSTADLSKDGTLDGKDGTLLVLGPTTAFSQKAAEEVKRWVDSKKGALFLIQTVTVNDTLQGTMNNKLGIEDVLKDKGIEIQPTLILDASSTIANFRTQSGSFLSQYPYWVQIRPENINQSLPPLSGIQSLLLPWVSPLSISGKAKVMIYTSSRSWTSSDLSNLSPLAKSTMGTDLSKKPVAALVTDNARLAVVGDADFIKDQFASNDQNNLALAFNLIDYLSQDESLLSIRAKTIQNPPLQSLNDKTIQIIRGGAISAPLILLGLIGLLSAMIRKKKQSSIYA